MSSGDDVLVHPTDVDVELLPGEGREGAVRAQVVPHLVLNKLIDFHN